MGVAELPYTLFVELQLTVVPDTTIPDPPAPKGHATVKEITSVYWTLEPDSELYQAIRGWAIDLAKSCKNLPIVPTSSSKKD